MGMVQSHQSADSLSGENSSDHSLHKRRGATNSQEMSTGLTSLPQSLHDGRAAPFLFQSLHSLLRLSNSPASLQLQSCPLLEELLLAYLHLLCFSPGLLGSPGALQHYRTAFFSKALSFDFHRFHLATRFLDAPSSLFICTQI